MATVAKVNTIPACDFCGSAASYDGKTIYGPWANMCGDCFKKYGVGLGTGRGQKLELNEIKKAIKCKICGRKPNEISEYTTPAKIEKISAADYVEREEGTYNEETKLFYCTDCYMKIGMPLGKA